MKKVMPTLLLILFLIGNHSASFAAENPSNQSYPSDKEVEAYSNKIVEINAKLEKPLSKSEKAELLYQKAKLELTFSWVTTMRSATEFLLEAIDLAPENKEYKNYLCKIYDGLWKNRNFDDGDSSSKDLQTLKDEVSRRVLEYRKRN